MKKPNILWICTDQQRFDTLGCYGNAMVRTPNIDKLALDGVLFEHAYAQCTVCTPSRASFLTGRYPRTTTCRQNGQSIPRTEKLISKQFSEAGYVCGLAGKQHLSACQHTVCKGTERRTDDGYDLFRWSHEPSPHWPSNEYSMWLQQHGVAYETKPFPGSEYVSIGMPAKFHHTTWCANQAIDFIRSCSAFDHPWFFSLNLFDPHAPFNPPASRLERYLERLESVPAPNYVEGELADKPILQQVEHEEGINSGSIKTAYRCSDMRKEDHSYIKAAYWAMVDLIDEQVGRIVQSLEETGQRENTLVIFMSDHGELLGDHGMYYKGPFFYDPAVRVPLILSWPSVIPERGGSGSLVELVDVAPTLLEAAGLERHPGMQGKSFWNLLLAGGGDGAHREDVYCEYYNALPYNKWNDRTSAAYGTMVRTKQYKLVSYHGLSTGELYDLQADPAETHNLWESPDHKDAKVQMLQRLCDRMAWTIDPLPVREANY